MEGITMPFVVNVEVPLSERDGSSEKVMLPAVGDRVNVFSDRDGVVVRSELTVEVSDGVAARVRDSDGVWVSENVVVGVRFGVAVRDGDSVFVFVRVGGNVTVPLTLWERDSVGDGEVSVHVRE
eukprot:PhM_4_TR2582/c0_g1_i1/m.59477